MKHNRIADISHVGVTCWMLGYDKTLDVASWNAVTWGNVGFTVSFSPVSLFEPTYLLFLTENLCLPWGDGKN